MFVMMRWVRTMHAANAHPHTQVLRESFDQKFELKSLTVMKIETCFLMRDVKQDKQIRLHQTRFANRGFPVEVYHEKSVKVKKSSASLTRVTNQIPEIKCNSCWSVSLIRLSSLKLWLCVTRDCNQIKIEVLLLPLRLESSSASGAPVECNNPDACDLWWECESVMRGETGSRNNYWPPAAMSSPSSLSSSVDPYCRIAWWVRSAACVCVSSSSIHLIDQSIDQQERGNVMLEQKQQ
jgi:hypothetical protein